MTERLPKPQRSVGLRAYYKPEILDRILVPLLDTEMPDRKVLLGVGVEITPADSDEEFGPFVCFVGVAEFPEFSPPNYGASYIRFTYSQMCRIQSADALVELVGEKVRIFKAGIEHAVEKRRKGNYSTSRGLDDLPNEMEAHEAELVGIT